MHVRLGFAVAAHLNPDVLLIDEVLAVGDIAFKAKCFNAIARLLENTAIIIVSHAMQEVARVCTDLCLLTKGKRVYWGKDVPTGIGHYYSQFEYRRRIVAGNHKALVHRIEFESSGKRGINEINYLDDLTVNLDITVDKEINSPLVNISFLNQELQIIGQCYSFYNNVPIDNEGKPLMIKLTIPKLNFNPGIYSISVSVTDETQVQVLSQHYAAKELKIKGSFIGLAPVQLQGKWTIR